MNSTASLALWMDKATYRAGEKARINVRLLQGEKPVPYESIQFILMGVVENHVGKCSVEEMIATLSTDEKGCVSFSHTLASHGRFIICALVAGYPEARAEIGCVVKPIEWAQPPFILKMSDAIGGDELISITGEGFTGTVQAVAEPLNRKNVNRSWPSDDAINLTLVQKDEVGAHFIVAQLPSDAPNGIYKVWVRNEFGWSKPYRLNEARALFISEYEVQPGQHIDVSGRNFDLRQIGYAAHHTQVRLVDAAGNAFGQKVTEVNPYRVQFRVTEDTPMATYRVEVSNNDGVTWSGLATEQTLTVQARGADPLGMGVAWASSFNWENRFSICDFGAKGDGETDDTEAIAAAIEAARRQGGGVVYFPEGRFVYKTLAFVEHVVFLGAGKEQTTLLFDGGDGENLISTAESAESIGHFGIACLTIEEKNDAVQSHVIWMGHAWPDDMRGAPHDQQKRTASCMFLLQVDVLLKRFIVDAATRSNIVLVGKERFLMRGCRVVNGAGMSAGYITRYMRVEDCDFTKVRGYIHTCAMYSFVRNVDVHDYPGVTDDRALTDYQYERDTHGFFGRAMVCWENCNLNDLGYQGDSECFCSETPNSQFGYGMVLSAAETTVKGHLLSRCFGDACNNDRQIIRNSELSICMMDGRGLGQLRKIRSISEDGNTIEIDKPWDVIPDSTSSYTLCTPNSYATVYKSRVDGGGTLCSFYGLGYDCVADDLIGHRVTGVNCHNTTVRHQNRKSFGYFLAYRNVQSYGMMPAPGRHRGEMGARLSNFRDELTGLYAGVAGIAQEFRNTVSVCNPAGQLDPGTRAAYNFRSTPVRDALKGDVTNVILENVHAGHADYAVGIGNSASNGIIVRHMTGEGLRLGDYNIPEGTVGFIVLPDTPKAEGGVLPIE